MTITSAQAYENALNDELTCNGNRTVRYSIGFEGAALDVRAAAGLGKSLLTLWAKGTLKCVGIQKSQRAMLLGHRIIEVVVVYQERRKRFASTEVLTLEQVGGDHSSRWVVVQIGSR